jgi:DNA processing protein
MLQRGCIVSEFPLGTAPRPYLFPIRNRIIAGLCQALLVIEAAERSGSLLSARLALECDREVLAVPGPIDAPLSVGTNRLIAQGARPVLDVSDVLEVFGLEPPAPLRAELDLTPLERRMLDLLDRDGVKEMDHFVEKLELHPAQAITTMMGLVLKNLVCQEGSGYRRVAHG